MHKRIYLDYAAATPLHPEVKKEMARVEKLWANASSLHKEGREARAVIDEARAKIATILNAQTANIVFTSGATESNVLALRGVLEYARLKGERPHLVISKIEHPSVKETAEQLEKMGLDVTWVNVDKNGLVSPEELASAVNNNTVLVSIIYANHELGTVQNISDLVKTVKSKNEKTLFHTDAAQALGWLDVDIEKLGVDLLTGSGYKLYGPKGVGFLYVRKDIKMWPQFPGFQEWGKRAGTESTSLIAGMAKALEISVSWPRERVRVMRNNLISKITQNISDVLVNTPAEQSVPHIAHFSFGGVEAQLLTVALDQEGVSASPGSACSSGAVETSHIVEAIGVDLNKYGGSLRLSLGLDTESGEVERASEIIKNTVNKLRRNP